MKSVYNDKTILRNMYEELKNGYIVAERIGVNPKTVYRWLKKYGITAKDYKKHTVNSSYFDKIDTEEKAYWLGFIMADGCIYRGESKNSYRFQMNLSSVDRDALEKFSKCICSDYKIVDVLIDNKETGRQYKAAQLKINNTEFCKGLMSHNVIPRKSKICEMPTIDKKLERHFVRGYFDGDGCISKKSNGNRWRFEIAGGINILNSFQEMLEESGISTHIYPIRNNVFTMVISSHSSIKNVFDLLYCNSTMFLKRKYDKFITFKSEYCPAEQRCSGNNQVNCGESLRA